MLELPILQFDHSPVYHVGGLDGPTSGDQSLEGGALSVSTVPSAWSQIHKLGGRPTFALKKPEAAFLDLLGCTPEQVETLRSRAIEAGLLDPVTVWRVYSTDEEGRERYFTIQDYEEARAEAFEQNGYAEDEMSREDVEEFLQATVERSQAYLGTDRLKALHAPKERGVEDPAIAEDLAFLALAPDLGLDGVWWRETFDPIGLSAPRGGIFPSDNLRQRWQVELVVADDAPEIDEENHFETEELPLPSGAISKPVHLPDSEIADQPAP